MMEEDRADFPTQFNTLDTKFLEVSKDKLTVKYVGKGSHSHDVGSIRANKPLPTDVMIAYFEVEIIDAGSRGAICVGLTQLDFLLNRQPGWEENSYGYLGEDGKKFTEGTRGEAFSEQFTTGDIIGCGIFYQRQEVFYTKNGKYLGVAFRKVKGTYYPTVGLHSPRETITVNFGQKPFKFDLEGMIQERKEKIKNEINSYSIDVEDINSIIRQYLLHYGYAETLKGFESAIGEGSGEMLLYDTLITRNNVRQAIISGNIEAAVKTVVQNWPVLAKDSHAMFAMQCQHFIEIVRSGQSVQAIEFAQKTLSSFKNLTKEQETHLQNILGILAYENPAESPLSQLLSVQERERVADIVNNAILSVEDPSHTPHSTLERLLKQLVASHTVLREKNGGKGEMFKLSDHI